MSETPREQEADCAPNATPLSDLRADALRHYEEAATAAMSWMSVIPRAINAYFDTLEAAPPASDAPAPPREKFYPDLRAALDAASPAQEATPPREQEQHQGWTKNDQRQEPLLKGDSPMEMGEFHNRDGWYFKRNADGSVRIQKRTPDAANTVELTHTIPPNEWTSIIAHLAANGGAGGNYAAAEQFHAGTVR